MRLKIKNLIVEAWDCIYGSKSHLNTAGKVFIGIPAFPLVAISVLVFVTLDFLFSKKIN